MVDIEDTSPLLQVSPAAIAAIKQLQIRRRSSTVPLRLCVEAGGCAERIYVLNFDPNLTEGDRLTTIDTIQIVVDAQSQAYVQGMTLDYSEDLMGGGFRFHNPKATRTCSCGFSFALDESSASLPSPHWPLPSSQQPSLESSAIG